MAKITRRTFLASSTVLALPTIVPSHVLGANGAVAPSNQITVGQIGFGWIGGSHLSTLLGRKDARYVGACDVNGDCLFMGSDIIYLVNYFRGGSTLSYCPQTPPYSGQPALPNEDNR